MSLWDPLLLDWLVWMRRAAPQLALRAEVGLPENLVDQVTQGTLDVAVVYAPQQKRGLKIELLIEEKLVLVTTARRGRGQQDADYVFVDWGPEFTAQHNVAFPGLSTAGTFVGLGAARAALHSRSGRFRLFPAEHSAALFAGGPPRRVKGTAEVAFPAYAVYSEGANTEMLTPALAGLRHVAAAQARADRKAPRLRSRRSARSSEPRKRTEAR